MPAGEDTMSIVLKYPVTGPAAWTGQDIQHDTSWIRHFTPQEIKMLDDAVAGVAAQGFAFS